MPEFKLVSPYKPTGDQPTAIEKLVSGLRRGDHEQTLLGVTGSGKSVTGDSPVLLRRNGVIGRTGIGTIVDEMLYASSRRVQLTGETEYLNLAPKDGQLETWSFDAKTGTSGWRKVTQLSRHTAHRTVAIQTSCGRSLQTTLDHNFFLARHGAIQLANGADIRIGDWLPVPDVLPEPAQELESIDISENLENSYPAYVEMEHYAGGGALQFVMGKSRETGMLLNGDRVKISAYRAAAMLAPMPAVKSIGSIKRKYRFNPKVALTKPLLRLIGYYIAAGHAAEMYSIFSTADKEVVTDLTAAVQEMGLSLRKRPGTYDYVAQSSLLASLLREMCGSGASAKKLPDFWPQLSNRQLAQILNAYFSGDGGVEKPSAVTATSASRHLVSELQLALHRFGIAARVRAKKIKYLGEYRNYFVLSISGSNQLDQFARSIGFSIERKSRSLNEVRGRLDNTNVDVIPLSGTRLKSLRTQLGFFQRDLASAAGVSRALISMIESELRLPSRKTALGISRALVVAAKAKGQNVVEAQELSALANAKWAKISSIKYHSKSQRVYDFAVDSTESFMAGYGGLFVHNTFTMANIVTQLQRPTLVLSHNKTLAAQLYGEFRSFFPDNAVQYFVSYYDYYQPEAYIARSDTFIEKDSSINEEIDRLRHAATMSLLTRRDVLIVASVSCIFGLGNVSDYTTMTIDLKVGERRLRDKLLRQLTDIQYHRNDVDFSRGKFRVRGDIIDIFPVGEETAYRLEFFGDELERLRQIDPLTGEITAERTDLKIFPAKHYVTPQEKLKVAVQKISAELDERLAQLESQGKNLEAQRLKQRTKFDLEMLAETGFVPGIENYSRFLSNREPGEQPATLLDYFPDDFLLFVDESHITLPQVRGMYNGDRARKETLVEYGFRLPSALDNRPLKWAEFERHVNQAVYVSATPADFELSRSVQVAEQVIRPTGLLDPAIDVRPITGQIDDLIAEIRATTAKGQRVLVTTLTKRMAEDLTDYLQELGIKVQYLHSEVNTLERVDILQDLRAGIFDVLIGINLLREGLDLPEVSLVAILDADKEGFLRGEAALIQTIGRAARHVEGRVIMYADHETKAMKTAIGTTRQRREVQAAYNAAHGITPEGIKKAMGERMRAAEEAEVTDVREFNPETIPREERSRLVRELTQQMQLAAENLQFEKAAALRDQIETIKPERKSARKR